ncbi:hypothetical protein J7U46_00055 [Pelomonas sp. V22]|uniref:hypothetical protein n=1 Tax=Pelomonas sp. V22 TaxID=2822139 RepID=UPI0024A9CFF0|nr:hypothetical protein [Pelomonas sp. V22]MDI4631433.1 hypothetical protein [Pelomonas sp. V22]
MILSFRPPLCTALFWLAASACPGFAHAQNAACVKSLSQANLKQIDSPSFHSIKRFSGTSLEVIKANGKLYQRMGSEPWSAAPFTVQVLRNAVAVAEKAIVSCERGGIETVDGKPAQVFKFSVKDPVVGVVAAQVWVGTQDGLPYREESTAVKATTSYDNVKAPM